VIIKTSTKGTLDKRKKNHEIQFSYNSILNDKILKKNKKKTIWVNMSDPQPKLWSWDNSL
jgi:hypothetical protein